MAYTATRRNAGPGTAMHQAVVDRDSYAGVKLTIVGPARAARSAKRNATYLRQPSVAERGEHSMAWLRWQRPHTYTSAETGWTSVVYSSFCRSARSDLSLTTVIVAHAAAATAITEATATRVLYAATYPPVASSATTVSWSVRYLQ